MELRNLPRQTLFKYGPQGPTVALPPSAKSTHLVELIKLGFPWPEIELFRQAIGESRSATLKLCLIYHHFEYALYLLRYHTVTSLQSKACCPLSLLAVRLCDTRLLFILCLFSEGLPPSRFARYIDRRGCTGIEFGRTALHVAVTLPWGPKCLKLLLEFCPDLKVKDAVGRTPLQHALARDDDVTPGLLRCIELLLRAQPSVSLSELQGLRRLRIIAVANSDNRLPLPPHPHDLKPGPFSLVHMSRLVLRKHIKKNLLLNNDENILLEKWPGPTQVLRFVRSAEYLQAPQLGPV